MIFPSLGTTDVVLQVDVLINFAQWALQDSEKVISALNDEQMKIRNVVLQNSLAFDILRAARRKLCHYYYPALYIYT